MQTHGSFDLWVDNQVLLARISGAWNKEASWLYFNEIKEITKPIIGNPWALLVYFDGEVLGTPETNQTAKEMVSWLLQNGLVSMAEIHSSNIIVQLEIERMSKEVPSEIERRHFSDEEMAFAWLASKGFPVQLAQLKNRQSQT